MTGLVIVVVGREGDCEDAADWYFFLRSEGFFARLSKIPWPDQTHCDIFLPPQPKKDSWGMARARWPGNYSFGMLIRKLRMRRKQVGCYYLHM